MVKVWRRTTVLMSSPPEPMAKAASGPRPRMKLVEKGRMAAKRAVMMVRMAAAWGRFVFEAVRFRRVRLGLRKVAIAKAQRMRRAGKSQRPMPVGGEMMAMRGMMTKMAAAVMTPPEMSEKRPYQRLAVWSEAAPAAGSTTAASKFSRIRMSGIRVSGKLNWARSSGRYKL